MSYLVLVITQMRDGKRTSYAEYQDLTEFDEIGKISLKDANIVPFIYAKNFFSGENIDLETLQKYVSI